MEIVVAPAKIISTCLASRIDVRESQSTHVLSNAMQGPPLKTSVMVILCLLLVAAQHNDDVMTAAISCTSRLTRAWRLLPPRNGLLTQRGLFWSKERLFHPVSVLVVCVSGSGQALDPTPKQLVPQPVPCGPSRWSGLKAATYN